MNVYIVPLRVCSKRLLVPLRVCSERLLVPLKECYVTDLKQQLSLMFYLCKICLWKDY